MAASRAPVLCFPMTKVPSNMDSLKADFDRDGFLIYDFEFPVALIDECAAITAELGEQNLARVQDLWRREPAVKSLGAYPRVMELLQALYAREPFPFQTLNFPVGTQQSTHADTIFFNSAPEHFMCGVWVALEDITMDNGPLHYFAGSHKLPIIDMDTINTDYDGDRPGYFAKASEGFEKHYGTIKKGEAVIWSANVLHGGSVITKPGRSRLSQVTHYYFENCIYTKPVLMDKLGKPVRRYPYDFARERFVPNRQNGKRVKANFKEFLAEHWYNLKKHTPSEPKG